jgi:hypothetical protein
MTNRQTDPSDSSAALSEAARAVVRDAGDPRIDVHLAALGLGPDAPAAAPARNAEAPELEALRRQVTELETGLAAAQARVRTLTLALLLVVVGAAVVLLLLLATRPS